MSFYGYRNTQNTAVATRLPAYKAVSIAARLSTQKGIEFTFDFHSFCFTQNRIQFWNPLLLFFCLGTVAKFWYFLIRSLTALSSTSRSRNSSTNPVLGSFNPRQLRSKRLIHQVYFITFISDIAPVLPFLSPLNRSGSSGSLQGG